jgi:hypothetical protein
MCYHNIIVTKIPPYVYNIFFFIDYNSVTVTKREPRQLPRLSFYRGCIELLCRKLHQKGRGTPKGVPLPFWWSLLNESRTLNEITCGDEILTPFG